MNIQNAIADLQLVGTSVRKINLKNSLTVFFDDDTVQKRFDLKSHIGNVSKQESCFWGNVVLNLNVAISDNEDEGADPALSLEFEIEGAFTYQGDDESDFKELLEINGSATVYSIARSMVTTISSQSFNGDKIILPMLNFFDLFMGSKQENE
ncbi:MAG: hypothetical protein CVU92_03670 [Firmicutes bacterium HGW-Firmicutes-17]|nr:MAG: hypothetical protein CVU92_03670 [Firmicutes bacterium HGW-Firmicutes-17]